MTDVAAPPMDRKRWWKLPVTMPPRELTVLFRTALADDYPDELWKALPRMPGEHLDVLAPCLRRDRRLKARILTAAHAEGGAAAMREAAEFLVFVGKSGSVPGALPRLKQLRPSKAFATSAVRVVLDQKREPELGEIIPFWTLLWVATRAKPSVIDALEQRAKKWDCERVLARVRRVVAR
ncbi:MAG TPA: hypothetical protein VLB44_01990 [Kofleriaceae bacterium]|nr:hypothetical protein [Kofleriaceae bacterium]